MDNLFSDLHIKKNKEQRPATAIVQPFILAVRESKEVGGHAMAAHKGYLSPTLQWLKEKERARDSVCDRELSSSCQYWSKLSQKWSEPLHFPNREQKLNLIKCLHNQPCMYWKLNQNRNFKKSGSNYSDF